VPTSGTCGPRSARFWDAATADLAPAASFWLGAPGPEGPWRRAQGWASAWQTRLFGRPGLFRPRLLPEAVGGAPGLYDLAPLRERLEEVIDFGLLNGHAAAPRLSVVATDLVSGERVVFDTWAGGTRVGPDRLLASCALPRDFAPLEVDGRLLGDGGLSANAPLDLVLDEPAGGDLVCFVLDLFAPEGGGRLRSLAAAAARALNLVFAGQTRLLLEGRRRECRLRAMIGRLAARLPPACGKTPRWRRRWPRAPRGPRPSSTSPTGPRPASRTSRRLSTSRAPRSPGAGRLARDMRAALRALAAPRQRSDGVLRRGQSPTHGRRDDGARGAAHGAHRRSGQALVLCPGRFLAAFAEPVPPMFRWFSFPTALAEELPGPVAVPPAFLTPPLPEPFSLACRSAFLDVIIASALSRPATQARPEEAGAAGSGSERDPRILRRGWPVNDAGPPRVRAGWRHGAPEGARRRT
jgi:predicted acylesterase/phospholipase RssA